MDLMNLKLEQLLGYDPDTKSFRGNPPIGYYRQPLASEYPLDLGKGYNQYIHRNGNFPRGFSLIQHHVMHAREPRQLLNNTDFFLNRSTMLKFMGDRTFSKDVNLAACRFKGCIYVRSLWEDVDERLIVPNVTKSYPYKARQYVFTRSPGEPPNIDAPVDERQQIYGIFTAKLGDLRLLYSAEVSGVSNTEPLGDLDDPEVLKKCQLASLRLKSKINPMAPLWLMQAYLGGIDHLAIASKTDCGRVCQPIEVVSCARVLWQEKQFNIHDRLKKMHNILQKISRRMAEQDDPTKELKFKLVRDLILFEDQFETIPPSGQFDQQFIDFTNQLYSPK